MANNFGRVNVSVSASTGGLTAGLSRAGKSLRSFASSVSSLGSPLSALGAVARSTFGQLALFSIAKGAIGTLQGMVSSAAEGVDQLSKLSRRLGTTYSELAGLKLAGDLAGVGIDSIATAMTKADVALVKAQGGSKQANAAFETLGLTAEQLAGMSGADRFEAIATAISRLPTEAERSAAAVALFGRSGAQLLPLFEGGASGIKQAREEAERFGLALTNAQGRNVEDMNDSFTRVGAAIQGVVQQVTAHLAPAITSIAQEFTNFVGSVGGDNIGQAIGEALLDGADYLAQVGDYIIANFGPTLSNVIEYLSRVGQQWADVMGIGNRVANLFYGAFKVFESVGNGVGFLIAKVTEKLLYAAASLTSVLPGYERMNANLQTSAVNMSVWADGSLKAMQKNMETAGTAIGDAIFGDAKDAGGAIAAGAAGPLQEFVRKARETAQAAADAVDTAKPSAAAAAAQQPLAAVVRISSQDLNAIIAGTTEGESFRNMLARGGDARLSGDPAKDTAENTERAADELEGLREDLAMNFGLAAINV